MCVLGSTANPLPSSHGILVEHLRWWLDSGNPSGEVPHEEIDEWWAQTHGEFFPWEEQN